MARSATSARVEGSDRGNDQDSLIGAWHQETVCNNLGLTGSSPEEGKVTLPMRQPVRKIYRLLMLVTAMALVVQQLFVAVPFAAAALTITSVSYNTATTTITTTASGLAPAPQA